MISKSWGLTFTLYVFALCTILLEVFTGITISQENITMLMSLVGISTAGGTTNAIFKNKEAIKKIIQDLRRET